MLDPTLQPVLIEDEAGGTSTGSATTIKAEPTGETFQPAPPDGGGGTIGSPPRTFSGGNGQTTGGGSPPETKPPTGFFPGVTAAKINPLFIFLMLGIIILIFNQK